MLNTQCWVDLSLKLGLEYILGCLTISGISNRLTYIFDIAIFVYGTNHHAFYDPMNSDAKSHHLDFRIIVGWLSLDKRGLFR